MPRCCCPSARRPAGPARTIGAGERSGSNAKSSAQHTGGAWQHQQGAPVIAELPLKQIICGIPELAGHTDAGVTHVLSILDPAEPEPAAFERFGPHERLTLRFDDIIESRAGLAPPTPGHVEQVLRFGRQIGAERLSTLLIHCHAGVSRSTASAASLLAQAFPDVAPNAIFTHLGAIRPQAWPNSLMIAFADEQLGAGGALLEALRRFHGRRLAGDPLLAEALCAGGRGVEVEMAIAPGA
jgi:predicted protein tyrosine phosphatase